MHRIAVISPDATGAMRRSLGGMDIEPIVIPRTGRVHPALSGHPDLQIFAHEGRVFCHPDIDRVFLRRMERHADIVLCGTRLGRDYPEDIPYNLALAGRAAFHRCDRTEPSIRMHLASKGIILADVPQGYAGCATLTVDDGAIITPDVPIHRAALENGLSSLLIAPGHIDLPGFPCGFIGGASGRSGGRILISGRLDRHPDHAAIESFIESRNKKITPLDGGRAVDLGTIIVMDCP